MKWRRIKAAAASTNRRKGPRQLIVKQEVLADAAGHRWYKLTLECGHHVHVSLGAQGEGNTAMCHLCSHDNHAWSGRGKKAR